MLLLNRARGHNIEKNGEAHDVHGTDTTAKSHALARTTTPSAGVANTAKARTTTPSAGLATTTKAPAGLPAKIWGPIVAGASAAVVAGLSAGVAVESQAPQKHKQVPAQLALNGTRNIATKTSQQRLTSANVIVSKLVTATVTPSPSGAQTSMSLMPVILTVSAVVLFFIAISVLLLLLSRKNAARKCVREVCDNSLCESQHDEQDDDPDFLQKAYKERSYKSVPELSSHSTMATSDLEDAPLLPEGAALPKFWQWLGNW